MDQHVTHEMRYPPQSIGVWRPIDTVLHDIEEEGWDVLGTFHRLDVAIHHATKEPLFLVWYGIFVDDGPGSKITHWRPLDLLDCEGSITSVDPEEPCDGVAIHRRCGADGSKWAAEFRKTALRLGYSDMDEGWLIGWFANAIEGAAAARARPTTIEPQETAASPSQERV